MLASLRASRSACLQVRRGLLTRDMLAAVVFDVDDLELLAGRREADTPEKKESRFKALAELQKEEPDLIALPGQTGHCQLDLTQLFALGVDGLLLEVRTREASAQDERKINAYQSFGYALEGFSLMLEHAALCASNSALKAEMDMPTWRISELQSIADACSHIAHQPPETFQQAIQLLAIAVFACNFAEGVGLVSPGRIDRVLYPYYQADLAAERTSPEQALGLIEALYLLLNENIPDGLAIAVMVGGRDETGADTTNTLSYLCLEALKSTRLVYPTVGVCWHDGTPIELTELAVDIITSGIANPAFFCDETIQRGLASYGVLPDRAWRARRRT